VAFSNEGCFVDDDGDDIDDDAALGDGLGFAWRLLLLSLLPLPLMRVRSDTAVAAVSKPSSSRFVGCASDEAPASRIGAPCLAVSQTRKK
jgi:hypothetical protein